MKFNIIINPTHNWSESTEHALQLCQSITATGHEVGVVFFYGNAVHITNDAELNQQWQHWQSQQHNPVQLMLCATMLEEAGLKLDDCDSTGCFAVVGLGSWVNALESADQTIELS